MPLPRAICIEDLRPGEGDRFLRCVALPGRQPGLRVSTQGTVLWKSGDDIACELWVSGDDRLILYRPMGAAPVRVERKKRSLDVPFDKPVVLLDQDTFHVGDRVLRVHMHGTTTAVRAPSPLPVRKPSTASRVAAVVALGAAVAGCNKNQIEVRDSPPAVPADFDGAPPDPPGEDAGPPEPPPTSTFAVEPPADPPGEPIEPIEVREAPPDMPVD
jgi:hypothetical protein